MKYDILLADDDNSIRLVLSKALTRAGHKVRATDNAETLLKWAEAGLGDMALTDVLMGAQDVFDFLPALAARRPHMPIIVMSANNTVNTALKAGTHKVFEYIPKPFDLENITDTIRRAGQSVNAPKVQISSMSKLPMIGRSAAMQPVFRAISRFASGDLPVLINGAVGTGKDLVARLLHDGGTRQGRAFLRLKDFSDPASILQKVGGGDIYIDELASLSAPQQDQLLAFISDIDRVAPGSRPRILSASREDLRERAKAGHFRDDLLFRLNVAEINLPRLAERGRDIYELAPAFLSAISPKRSFHEDALAALADYNWPGNVRELENLVRRLALLYSDDVITADMVLQERSGKGVGPENLPLETRLEEACRLLLRSPADEDKAFYQAAIEWIEKPLFTEALKITHGNKAKAAALLGIHRNTLRTKLRALKTGKNET